MVVDKMLLRRKPPLLKLVMCGEGGVGKTSLVRVYTGMGFSPYQRLTVGTQHFFKEINHDGKRWKLVIWDLGGEERFRFLAPVFLKGARGAVFVFDITREGTFEKLDEWLNILKKTIGDIPRVLVGNKIDLEEFRLIPSDLAEEYARSRGFIGYIETSARAGVNVNRPFDLLLNKVLAKPRYYDILRSLRWRW